MNCARRFCFSWVHVILAFGAVWLLSACSDGQRTPVDIGNEQQILHIGNGDEPADVDPHVTTGIPERQIQVALCEGLTSKKIGRASCRESADKGGREGDGRSE